jgi:hypothetical protein
VNVIGCEPFHVPLLTLRVLPTLVVPVTTGPVTTVGGVPPDPAVVVFAVLE